jgi:integrase
MPDWVKKFLDDWTTAAGISEGNIFRRINRDGKVWGPGITSKSVWHVVKAAAKRGGFQHLAPHNFRRTCARLCHLAGGELEQIQFLLGHVSILMTETCLGCKQKFRHAVNDSMGLNGLPEAASSLN